MQNEIQSKITESLNWRAAVKVYDREKAVDPILVEAILEAGRMAPTAYGIQPFEIIQVEDMDMRTKVREAAYGQAQVTEAPHLFVIAVRTDLENNINQYVENIAQVRGVTLESLDGFKKSMMGDILSRSEEAQFAWAGRQAYIAFGFMLETAALLKVDASPMEGFSTEKVDEVLGLKDMNLKSLGLLVLGYRGDDKYSQMKKVRFPKEEIIVKK